MQPTFRDHLRMIPTLVGTPAEFDPARRPTTPRELFLEWFRSAEEAGVAEPHAMTMSTIDANGMPDSRMLVLKDLTPDGAWCFAGRRDSRKGRDLSARPVAAMLFYWREQVRSVRIRGHIREGSRNEARADFLARPLDARAVALSGQQGAAMTAETDLQQDVEAARLRLSADPELAPEDWTVWKLTPVEVEFWQGSDTRLHSRLRYEYSPAGWVAEQLRP